MVSSTHFYFDFFSFLLWVWFLIFFIWHLTYFEFISSVLWLEESNTRAYNGKFVCNLILLLSYFGFCTSSFNFQHLKSSIFWLFHLWITNRFYLCVLTFLLRYVVSTLEIECCINFKLFFFFEELIKGIDVYLRCIYFTTILKRLYYCNSFLLEILNDFQDFFADFILHIKQRCKAC